MNEKDIINYFISLDWQEQLELLHKLHKLFDKAMCWEKA